MMTRHPSGLGKAHDAILRLKLGSSISATADAVLMARS